MKSISLVLCFVVALILQGKAQNTLDNAGLTAATPSEVAYSLRS